MDGPRPSKPFGAMVGVMAEWQVFGPKARTRFATLHDVKAEQDHAFRPSFSPGASSTVDHSSGHRFQSPVVSEERWEDLFG